jgi:hypothetical protein
VRIVGTCPYCGSDLLDRQGCPNAECGGLSDEDHALRRVRDDYANGRINEAELERRVQTALTDPPCARRGPSLRYW